MPPLGLIEIQIEGISKSETERLQLILHRLIIQGILGIKNGSMMLHFNENQLVTVEVMKRWRAADKPQPLRPVEKVIDARGSTATIGMPA